MGDVDDAQAQHVHLGDPVPLSIGIVADHDGDMSVPAVAGESRVGDGGAVRGQDGRRQGGQAQAFGGRVPLAAVAQVPCEPRRRPLGEGSKLKAAQYVHWPAG